MPDQIYIGNYTQGLQQNVTAFNVNNEAFPMLNNFYIWRGRVKKKRGTILLGQLRRQVKMVAATTTTWEYTGFNLVADAGNLLSDLSLESTGTIVPGSISITVGANTYTDSTVDGILTGAPGGTGTIDYATGTITISGGGASQVTGTFSYYPGLPVMGLADQSLTFNTTQYPLLHSFDTVYDYQINQSVSPPVFYTTNYYKNSENIFYWSGADYQQFWTTNYEGAMWATNNRPGFHFQNISSITVGNPTTINTASAHNLNNNDWVYFNEITGADAALLNGQAFQVTVVTATRFTVNIDTTAKVLNNDGIFQKLTYGTDDQDGIRWYDGDPTGGTGLPTSTGLGWVNFAPPLTSTTVSISNETAAKYYLVGALAIVNFKDRLLFFSPWIQTSSGSPIQLEDTVIWSWNGTPYYNILVPSGKTYDNTAYYVDQAGKGGYLSAGIAQPIATVADNEDVLIVGFGGVGLKSRLVYTSNDLSPFLFYSINSELPSNSTFSAISLDEGVIDIGKYGIAITTQQTAARIDLQIPNAIFNMKKATNGVERVNSVRDYLNEWIYFTIPYYASRTKFPIHTLFYNYRENNWAIFYENYTAQGHYRPQTKRTWATIGFPTWDSWREPWNSGSNAQLYVNVVGGNPQGYVLIRGEGTGEAVSGTIYAIADDGSGNTQITSYNHCLTNSNVLTGDGDYVYFQNGIINGGSSFLNGKIGKVIKVVDDNNYVVDIDYVSETYLGLGQFIRLCQPFLQTKQFPFYWQQGRQTRLCAQKYLFDTTANSQATIYIYLSQNPDTPYNLGPITPNPSLNNSLVYSELVYTCPESTNIGLTPANTNLQMPVGEGSLQLWHRINTSLIGDSVQIGLTLNEIQMKELSYAISELTLNGMQLTVTPSQLLA